MAAAVDFHIWHDAWGFPYSSSTSIIIDWQIFPAGDHSEPNPRM
jgi:hypothetical protein